MLAMPPEVFGELFPLFSAASPETMQWLLSVATQHNYPANRAIVMEDSWGNAVYFLEAGWVKVRRHVDDGFVTLAVLGRGDFFGEMAILDESPRSTDVVAMTPVKLLSISAQRFIQTLFKDSQLHHRLLQLMVQRLRQSNGRFQLRHQPPAVKLASTLVALQQAYGQPTDEGVKIINLPYPDLADLSDITVEESQKIMDKLQEKDWLRVDNSQSILLIKQPKQMAHLASKSAGKR
jgi:CRP/FNR family cyclic AMP-dependent transcriptional regulator